MFECVCLPNRKYEPCEQYVEHSSTSKSTNLPSRLRLMRFYYGRNTDESCLEAEKYSAAITFTCQQGSAPKVISSVYLMCDNKS